MATSSGFFIFTHVIDDVRYAIAYKPPGPIERGAYEDLVQAMCQGPHVPDAIVVVAIKEDKRDVLSDLRAGSARVAQERLTGRIPLYFVSFEIESGEIDATLLDPSFEGKKGKQIRVLRSPGKWIQSGLMELFSEESAVLRAPPGYTYEKPSGSRTAIFLKPDLALTSSAAVSFVALGLFQKVFSGKLSNFDDLRTVFIDSMAIAPVAYELRQLFGLCRPSSPFHIESFHSYGGFERVGSPMPGTSLCIISASTTMDLHGRWVAEKQVSQDEVVTILTLKDVKKYRSAALVAISCTGFGVAEGPVQLSIRIRGESFLPEQEPAKKVLLTDRDHRSDSDVSLFSTLAGKGIFDIYRREPRSGAKVRALYVNGEALMQEELFKGWLPKQLRQTIKASTKVIVHQNDKASKTMAEMVASYCSKSLQMHAPKVVPVDGLTSKNVPKSSGVIVCGAVVGKGSQLLEISRTLRDLHDGPRLFLIGFQVAESRGEVKGLVANLRHSKGVPHEILHFGHAAIGTQLLASYERECALFYPSSSDSHGLPVAIRDRGKALGGVGPVGDMSLLPHGESAAGTMRLRPGFAFWKEVRNPCQPSVIATMSVLLQRAREDKLPDDRRLATASYRHVVLDPENFARYNDGVIQAAILRSAYPSELDYRADYASSDYMKSIIVRTLNRVEQQAGEAALEFIAALATKKLQVMSQHMEEICEAAGAAKKRSRPLAKALTFLLKPTTGGRKKLPF